MPLYYDDISLNLRMACEIITLRCTGVLHVLREGITTHETLNCCEDILCIYIIYRHAPQLGTLRTMPSLAVGYPSIHFSQLQWSFPYSDPMYYTMYTCIAVMSYNNASYITNP